MVDLSLFLRGGGGLGLLLLLVGHGEVAVAVRLQAEQDADAAKDARVAAPEAFEQVKEKGRKSCQGGGK